MSSLLHPVGPEPASVYWVRRAAVLLTVVTVVVLLWWLVAGRGGDQAPTSSASPIAQAPSVAPVASPASTLAPAEVLPCGSGGIVVEATTDAGTYPVGATPRLTLTITNNSGVACSRDVGPKANELKITSGGYPVWSSDDCGAIDESNVVVLQPGQQVAKTVTWKGRTSEPGCPNDGKQAKAGRYDVIGRNLKVESAGTPFAIANPS